MKHQNDLVDKLSLTLEKRFGMDYEQAVMLAFGIKMAQESDEFKTRYGLYGHSLLTEAVTILTNDETP